MDENNDSNLAKARIERAKELLQDAELLLGKESYASPIIEHIMHWKKHVPLYLQMKKYKQNHIGE